MQKAQEKEQLCPACGCHIGTDAYEKENVFTAATPVLPAVNVSVVAVKKGRYQCPKGKPEPYNNLRST